ncbi:ATP-binding protein [Photobacterium rosenbergii]|uniref:ATP-binding protein n=2 Tax=Vibrionaceae TaxID=641 RepID=A0ABU3ZC00_9GAMM|nr:ATP-binding protein [Photobacterium rosenbergii]MDV5167428.1 ATP-binding protein [Photobacterium rosenbergii]
MSYNEFVGTAEITDQGIRKHFTKWKKVPLQSVIELVANGFDANAKTVHVDIEYSEMDGLVSVSVLDDGTGIDIGSCDEHFSRFYESSKKDDDDLQGAHGRGRLAFHLLCNDAIWFTKRSEGKNAKISIQNGTLREFRAAELTEREQIAALQNSEHGTYVQLSNFTTNLPTIDVITAKLQCEFGWRLALNKNRKLYLNGEEVEVPDNQLVKKKFQIEDESFYVSFVRWFDKPGVEKSYNYLVNSDGRVVFRQLSSFNKKTDFYLSTYTSSKWIRTFDKYSSSLNFTNEPLANPNSPIYKELLKRIYQVSSEIYEQFQIEQVEMQIALYENKGFFPEHSNLSDDERAWRRKNIKSVVREIYVADPTLFRNLKPKQAKILIALLDKVLVSNENDDLLDVLECVLGLEGEKLSTLSNQLSKTSLENVIATIEVLQKRDMAVYKLRELMVRHYKEVLETPDLQQIIEKNTWLFGNQYSLIGAEEADFQKIAVELRNHVKGINTLDEEDFEHKDLEEGLNVEGVRRQVDLFLARKMMAFDSSNRPYFKCTIIEIKKPSVALNRKHLNQIKDYARIIAQHVGFSDQKMKFELILVGRKVSDSDYDIPSALETAEEKNEPGLVFSQDKGRIKGFVKTWATIFDEFELSNHYLLEKLKLKRDSLEGETSVSLVSTLQEEES